MNKTVICGLLVFSFYTTSSSASGLNDIRTLWYDKSYGQVITELLSFRDSEFGKTVEVDYMLATSLCRYGSDHDLGRAFLVNILRVYELSDANRDAIAGELGHCPDQNQPENLAFLVSRSSGDAGVRGKLFYFVDGPNPAIGGDPLESVREIPEVELQSRLIERPNSVVAEREMGERLSALGFNPNVLVSDRFVIGSISGHSNSDLNRIAVLLEKALDYFVASYNVNVPSYYLSVYLVPDGLKIREIGSKFHGLKVKQGTIGYSFRNDLSVVSVVRGPHTGTLKHELTHLLVRSNFGDIPPWLDEGLAALYEVSRQEGSYLRGLPNWRGEVLKRYWTSGEPHIYQLLGMNWKEFDAHNDSMKRQAVHHALARYWVLFLQDKGYLNDVYNAFRTRDIRDITDDSIADADRLTSTATQKDLFSLVREFEDWLGRATITITRRDIKDFQRRLAELGYPVGKIDGFAGPKTRRAVQSFQLDNEIEADGIIDQVLIGLIKSKTGK